jgi:hypothetical protein
MFSTLKQVAKAARYTSFVTLKDLMANPRPAKGEEATKALEALNRDGFVNLGCLIPLGDLPQVIAGGLEKGETLHPGVTRFYLKNPLKVAPALDQWLRHPVLNEIVRAYLGGDTVFDRCLVWRIPAAANKRNTSAIWHHDWCGRRLKLFVLLHDVGETGRPTQFVKGSHKGQLRWMNYQFSRYSDQNAESRGEVVKLTGKAGDCILLDTNGLHRATGEGGYEARDIICMEYSDRAKSDSLAPRRFEIGIRKDILPDDFQLEGTLLSPAHVRKEGGSKVYGSVPQLESEPFV